MSNKKKQKPSMDPASREGQLISLAVDMAEKQLRDGTASPSTLNHFLKLGSTREQKEQVILENKAKLVSAQAEEIEHKKQSESLAQQVIESMKSYTPTQ